MRKALIATAFALVFVVWYGVTNAHAESLTVCDDIGVCQFTTIQDAVDHAQAGDEMLNGFRDYFRAGVAASLWIDPSKVRSG